MANASSGPASVGAHGSASKHSSPLSARKIARVFGYLLSSRVLSALLQAVTFALFARLVAPASFAGVSAIIGASMFASAVLDLGLTTAATREAAAGRHSVLRGLTRANAAVTAAVATVGTVSVVAAVLATDSGWLASVAPFVLWLAVDRLAEFRAAVSLGLGHPRVAALNLIVRRAIPAVVLVVAAWVQPEEPVLWLSLGYTLGAVVGLFIRTSVRAPASLAARPGIVASVRSSTPFWVNSMSAQSRQLDVAIVSAVSGVAGAVIYSPAARLISPLRLIPTSLAQAAMPMVASSGRVRPTDVRRLVLAAVAPVGAAYIVLGIFAPEILSALFGPNYRSAALPLRILLAGLVLAGVASMFTAILQGTGAEARAARANVATAILSLGLIAVGAAVAGGAGAAAGLAVGYAAQAGALFIQYRKSLESADDVGARRRT
ncbi:polysaccharide biosynthesis C-terminal domain-containing protein [uncultured Cellulomonas sp.]|uniref:lipopolysaccharide biosynthesis protein n=1 Tax=uncultured Cellulomonas sp. TaxID=189682 RepID=UPI0028E46F27|nr:polysaccharide biosynthesis C-terminal domain-containing protein [uncultured Cellulomonas sp.]